jgi:hypothetical protein
MTRLPGWRAALAAEIERHRRLPFAWGENDCVLFAADCVTAVTGEDPAAEIRGRYRTAIGARRLLKKLGDDLPVGITARFDSIHPSRARIGDLALTPSADASFTEGALGIVTGAVVTVVAPNGLGAVPLSSAIAAWRV